MTAQKQSVVELVQGQRAQGRTVAEVLGSLGVARSSYYRWKKGEAQRVGRRQSPYEVSAEEKKLIEDVKEQYPLYRHRRIQGGVATAGRVSVDVGDLRAFESDGASRALRATASTVAKSALRGLAEKPDVGQ